MVTLAVWSCCSILKWEIVPEPGKFLYNSSKRGGGRSPTNLEARSTNCSKLCSSFNFHITPNLLPQASNHKLWMHLDAQQDNRESSFMFRCETLLCHASDLLWNMRCWPLQETKQWINQFGCISPLFILQESIITLFYWKQEVFWCGHSTELDMDISKWYTSWRPILQLFFFLLLWYECKLQH